MQSNLTLVSLLLLPLLVLSATPLAEHEYAAHFADWMTEHNVAYPSDVLATKFTTFKTNHAYITQHNEEAAAGLHSYILALNKYADLSSDEYRSLLGYVSRNATGDHKFRPASTHMMKLMQMPRHHSSTGDRAPRYLHPLVCHSLLAHQPRRQRLLLRVPPLPLRLPLHNQLTCHLRPVLRHPTAVWIGAPAVWLGRSRTRVSAARAGRSLPRPLWRALGHRRPALSINSVNSS